MVLEHRCLHELLARDDLRGLREHGELYVFEFDGGYEIDWDLSSLLPSRAVILGRAAHDTRQKIPCRMSYPAPGVAGANEGERTSQSRNPPSWDSCG